MSQTEPKLFSHFIWKIAFMLIPLLACKKGEPIANQPPETRIFVEKINLSAENRLNSIVKLYWSGEDQDGYVAGYELSQDAQQWTFVERQDSTFRFDLKAGSDTTDIDFWVRAIDDQGLADPSPAYLLVPIKNSPPVAKLDSIRPIPDVVQGVFSVLWTISDLDGAETLDSIFLKLNDGPWYAIEATETFATFSPTASFQTGPQPANVYQGTAARLLPAPIEGLKVGEENVLYLRARDLTGAFSKADTSNSFMVKEQTGDLLIIDAHNSTTPDGVYFPILDQIYPNYDYLNLRDNFPPFWDPTFGVMLRQYDKVFWYSDGTQHAVLGQKQLLEVAANQVQLYLNQGGKMLTTTKFPSTFIDPDVGFDSPIFGFSPMDSLSSSPGQARIVRSAIIIPVGDFSMQLDTLVNNAFITGADPFYAKNNLDNLLLAEITSTGGWVGPSTVCGSSRFTNGEINQIFCSIELHLLTGRPEALNIFFDFVFNDALDW